MLELEHEDLFNPPEDTTAIVIPVCGRSRVTQNTYTTPMSLGYALKAKKRWAKARIQEKIGILQHSGARPYILTKPTDSGKISWFGKAGRKQLNYHVISLPTRMYEEVPIDADFLWSKLRALVKLCDADKAFLHLQKGRIVIPQFCTTTQTWADFRSACDAVLPSDRYVLISGKEGTQT